MRSPFIRKLEHSGFLSDADRDTLGSVAIRRRHVSRSQDLIREGDEPEDVIVVLEGFACRYKLMPKGRRHIMALLVPGDFCDLHVALLRHMDHGICTLSDCEIAEIPRATVEHLTKSYNSITHANPVQDMASRNRPICASLGVGRRLCRRMRERQRAVEPFPHHGARDGRLHG